MLITNKNLETIARSVEKKTCNVFFFFLISLPPRSVRVPRDKKLRSNNLMFNHKLVIVVFSHLISKV